MRHVVVCIRSSASADTDRVPRDRAKSVRENLAAVLDTALPGPGVSMEGDEGEALCEICYVSEMLDVICPNEKCAKRYHADCLLSVCFLSFTIAPLYMGFHIMSSCSGGKASGRASTWFLENASIAIR